MNKAQTHHDTGALKKMSFQDEEKRRSKRIPVSLEGKLISSGKYHAGFIENISEHGLHIIIASKTSKTSFIHETNHEVKIQHPTRNKITLYCEVRWVHINKTPIHALTYRMGMEILNQLPE